MARVEGTKNDLFPMYIARNVLSGDGRITWRQTSQVVAIATKSDYDYDRVV